MASGSRSGDVKGKGKAVTMSPRAGEKKKCIKKLATKVVDSDVKIVARSSTESRSGSSHALLQCMDHLILVVENLAEAQWCMASACMASGVVVGTLVDECTFLGYEGSEPEEVDMDTEAVEHEITNLQKEVLEPWPLDDEV